MKRLGLPLIFLVAACNGDQDRLSDAQAARDPVPGAQAVPAEQGFETVPAGAGLPIGPGEVVYKALGNEPGWALTIRRNAMMYQGDYGTVRIVEATPPGFKARAGTTRSGRLTLTIEPGPCSDGMSDKVWRDKVSVSVAGGRSVQGCGGGAVEVNAIEGTLWRVTAIDGAPTSGETHWLQWRDGRVSGRFGCNVFGGTYSRNGDHLSLTSGLEQNAMGCDPEVTRIDSAGQRILGSNLRIEQVAGRTRLVSEAGTIELENQGQKGSAL